MLKENILQSSAYFLGFREIPRTDISKESIWSNSGMTLTDFSTSHVRWSCTFRIAVLGIMIEGSNDRDL